jgi:hypothetical protein
MRAAGVQVAIGHINDDETRQIRLMPQYAGNLVALNNVPGATGLSWGQAFAAISSAPAAVMGLEGEIGSLRPGRRGDVVIWDGDPLELSSDVQAVWIDGVSRAWRTAKRACGTAIARRRKARCRTLTRRGSKALSSSTRFFLTGNGRRKAAGSRFRGDDGRGLMDPTTSLALATAAFVGTHLAMSHPLRAALVARLGDGGFASAYSLIAAATLAWMVFAYRAGEPGTPLWVAPLWAGGRPPR